MTMKMNILIIGIMRKVNRGELLEDILTSYVNLTEDEKQEIRQKIGE